MKTKLLLALLTTIVLEANAITASDPTPSPSFSGGVSVNQTRSFDPHLVTNDPPTPISATSTADVTTNGIDAYSSTPAVLKSTKGKLYYFISSKN